MKHKLRSQRKSELTFDRIEARELHYLYIADSQIPNSGKGLYTIIPIWKNEIICLFKGEMLSADEARKREKRGDYKYFLNLPDGSTMDSKHVKCFAKYANDANGYEKTRFKLNSIITLDDNNNICLVATKNIKAREEIFCSYGNRYWKKFKKETE
jgi:SET domain-containing protein